MAKGYNKPKQAIPNSNGTPKTFTTSTGIEVRILGLSQLLLDKTRTSVKFPDPPTYELETVAGKKEVHAHNETTLETDEDKKAWADYQTALAEADRLQKDRLLKLILMKGIEVDMPEEEGADDDWLAVQAFIGLEVPEDTLGKRYDYITTEVISNPEDLAEIMQLVMEKSGVPKEALAEARASFRSAMEQLNSAPESGNQGE